jgi:hypothetical protein
MIRWTLVNRARRQRDLARSLIARHPLAAHDQRQPRLAERPAAYSDDVSWRVPATVEAAPTVYHVAPTEVEPVAYNPAPPETETPLAAWREALAASTQVEAQPAAGVADAAAIASAVPEDASAPRAESMPPAAATEQRPSQHRQGRHQHSLSRQPATRALTWCGACASLAGCRPSRRRQGRQHKLRQRLNRPPISRSLS